MANLEYNLNTINRGINGGNKYLDDFSALEQEQYGGGTVAGLMNKINQAVNGYMSVEPNSKGRIQDFNNETAAGFWSITVDSDTQNNPISVNDVRFGLFGVIVYGTIIHQFVIFSADQDYGKLIYRRGVNGDNGITWNGWRYPIVDTENGINQFQKILSGISSETGFKLKGHQTDGDYDYNLALKASDTEYGLVDNDDNWILYKPKESQSGNFIFKGDLEQIVPVEKGGSGLAVSPSMKVDLASDESADIMVNTPEPGVKGVLPLSHGGTGRNLSNIGANYIMRRSNSNDQNHPALYGIQPIKGALYYDNTVQENSEVKNPPKFGTLPIECGGTGYNEDNDRVNLSSYLNSIKNMGYNSEHMYGVYGKSQSDGSVEKNGTTIQKDDNLLLLIGDKGLNLYDRTQGKTYWYVAFGGDDHTYVKRAGDSMDSALTIKNDSETSTYGNAYINLQGTNNQNLPKGEWPSVLEGSTRGYKMSGAIYFGPNCNGNSLSSLGRIASARETDNNGKKQNIISIRAIENASNSENSSTLFLIYDSGDLSTDSTAFDSAKRRIKTSDSTYFQATRIYATDKMYAKAFVTTNSNDYAEYRKTINLTPGHVVIDNDDGSLSCSNQRLQPGAQIISDTFGYTMGENKECKTPLAVAGRVLAYTYQSQKNYHAGMAVCSAPNGTVDIMTREEIRNYPDCIIGIVSEIPQYETWGENIKVDGRIWIKIK